MEKRLKESIATLYAVFDRYTLEDQFRNRCCPCCVTDKEIKEITEKSLERLSEEELAHFFTSAITTFGDLNDYKHFLPRLLELMTDSDSDLLFDFTYFEKLNYAEWETWPQNEQKAIRDFFQAFWHATIHDKRTNNFQIEGVLNIILDYGFIDAALLEWYKSKTLTSLFFIVEGVLNGFYFKIEESRCYKITEWLQSHDVLKKLEKLYFETKNPELASKISIAYTILENKYPLTFN